MTNEVQTLQADRVDARERTLDLVKDFEGDRWIGPEFEIVNPPLWELGHVGWFHERWVLREGLGRQPKMVSYDDVYDSTTVEHRRRWRSVLPTLERTRSYLREVADDIGERLAHAVVNDRIAYLVRLATYHEDMHDEALLYARQTLGDPKPVLSTSKSDLDEAALIGGPLAGDVVVEGAELQLGADNERRFVFDNEKWAHPVDVATFRLSRAPVTEAEYAAFVDAGGYRRPELWCQLGWAWCRDAQIEWPVYWRTEGGDYRVREFDQWRPLQAHRAMMHVNWFEAQAFCRWAGRRLPTEAEWELAACGRSSRVGKPCTPWRGGWSVGRANVGMRALQAADVGAFASGDTDSGLRQMIGNVWEWTASTFEPYPGFAPDAYPDYSRPWFGSRKVLRGGSFATQSRMLATTLRNFHTPDRQDLFAGFRTAAI